MNNKIMKGGGSWDYSASENDYIAELFNDLVDEVMPEEFSVSVCLSGQKNRKCGKNCVVTSETKESDDCWKKYNEWMKKNLSKIVEVFEERIFDNDEDCLTGIAGCLIMFGRVQESVYTKKDYKFVTPKSLPSLSYEVLRLALAESLNNLNKNRYDLVFAKGKDLEELKKYEKVLNEEIALFRRELKK